MAKADGRNLTAWEQEIRENGEVLFASATVYDIISQGARLIGLVHVEDNFPGASRVIQDRAELTVVRPYGSGKTWHVL